MKTFCEICRKDVNYTISCINLYGKIKGKEYQYIGKEARCEKCGAPVFVHEINDSNLESLYDVYRKENNIISLNNIKAIPNKYGIGKRPLSLLLGWGEQTFSRYCEGEMPTRQYSDILTKIWEDPSLYLQILEKNKENLKTTFSYEKSLKTVNKLINCSEYSNTKINNVIKYLLNECEDITPLALQKALYYIQGFYYAFHKEFLFKEDCQAWTHGPAYRDIYLRYRNYHFDPIKRKENVDKDIFTLEEIEVIDSIINNICCYSGKVLDAFTHSESPWIITRGDLPLNEPSNKIIKKELIGDYFIEVKDKYNMISPMDIKVYTRDMFTKEGERNIYAI